MAILQSLHARFKRFGMLFFIGTHSRFAVKRLGPAQKRDRSRGDVLESRAVLFGAVGIVAIHTLLRCVVNVQKRNEDMLSVAAVRAGPPIGQILEGGSGRSLIFRTAFLRIVDVPADLALHLGAVGDARVALGVEAINDVESCCDVAHDAKILFVCFLAQGAACEVALDPLDRFAHELGAAPHVIERGGNFGRNVRHAQTVEKYFVIVVDDDRAPQAAHFR